MGLSIDELLRQQFELATLRQMAKAVDHPDIWQRAHAIMQRSSDLRTRAKDLFEDTYQRRVDSERLRCIDDAGKLKLDLVPRWAGTDGFDPDRTLALAERTVRLAYERRIARIDRAEARQLAKLLPKPDDRPAVMHRQTFNRRARDGPSQD